MVTIFSPKTEGSPWPKRLFCIGSYSVTSPLAKRGVYVGFYIRLFDYILAYRFRYKAPAKEGRHIILFMKELEDQRNHIYFYKRTQCEGRSFYEQSN